MDFESLLIKKLTIDKNFDYSYLYNDDVGAIYKDEYKLLIREAISKDFITIEKFLIAEDVRDELYQISEESKGLNYTLIDRLKAYHNESNHLISPIIYILKQLDPNFSLIINEGELKLVSKNINVQIRPRIDEMNARPRLFFPKEKIAITLKNDNIENLGDILAVQDVKVYIISTDNPSNKIYAYKISRTDEYFKVAEGYKQRVQIVNFDKISEIMKKNN